MSIQIIAHTHSTWQMWSFGPTTVPRLTRPAHRRIQANKWLKRSPPIGVIMLLYRRGMTAVGRPAPRPGSHRPPIQAKREVQGTMDELTNRATAAAPPAPSRGQRARRRRHRLRLARTVATLFIALILVGALYYNVLARPRGAADGTPASGSQSDSVRHGTNILVMGIDERPGDHGRSDTMMLVCIDPDRARVNLLSIPRDTLVTLPGHGQQKINAAYAYGGPSLAKQTVAELTGLPVDYYIKVNLRGFVKLVDLVGGVDINVPEKMDYEDPTQGLSIHLRPGMQHLDGETALGYVRFRGDPRADLGRIERQQGFLRALAGQVLKPSILPKLPALIAQARSMVATDIPAAEQVSLAVSAYRSSNNGVEMATVPGTPKYIDGISYYVPDLDKLRQQLSAWVAQ